MSHTRTYALQGNQPPGWMHIAPIHPLTHDQWHAAEAMIVNSEIIGPMTTRQIAKKAAVSLQVARSAMKKLQKMGLASVVWGGRSPRYQRKFYRR